MDQTVFSIVIAAYIAENTPRGTLDSLPGQTMAARSAIVVDDGLTDATAEIGRSCTELPFRGLIGAAVISVSPRPFARVLSRMTEGRTNA